MSDARGAARFAVYGAGALGCFLAAALARAGHRVALIARGRHLEAIARDGIHVEGPEGSFTARLDIVTEDAAEIGPVEGVLLAVKAWQVPEAARAMKPLLDADTCVLPIQNGVEASDQIAEAVGANHPLIGLCRIVCLLEAPGRVRHVAVTPTIALGSRNGGKLSGSAASFAAALEGAGIVVERPADIRAALWQKLLFIAPVSGIGSVSRSTVGEIRSTAATRTLVTEFMKEVLAVARASEVHLADDVVPRTLAFLDAMAPESTTSMQRDFAEGKPSEVEAIVGVVVKTGEASGISTPVARYVYGCLLPQEMRARGSGGRGPSVASLTRA